MVDVVVFDHGSIVVLIAQTVDGQSFFDEHIPEDAPRWGQGYPVERRFVPAILEGLEGEGLTWGVPDDDA